jgi:cytochrome P450
VRDDIRLLAEDFWVEPEDRWAWMRAHAPVYWDDDEGTWPGRPRARVDGVARLADLLLGQGSRPESSVPSMINMDGDEHSFLRGIVKRDFTVRRSRRSAGSARVAPHAPADERRRGLGDQRDELGEVGVGHGIGGRGASSAQGPHRGSREKIFGEGTRHFGRHRPDPSVAA